MYDVPKEYRAAIRSPTRKDRMAGKLTLTDGSTIELTDSAVISGSVSVDNQCVSGQELAFGSVYMGQASLQLRTALSSAAFYDAALQIDYEIQLADGSWYTLPVGRYTVAEAERSAAVVSLTGYDNMLKLERKFSGSAILGDAYTMLTQIAGTCGVELAQREAEIKALSPNAEILRRACKPTLSTRPTQKYIITTLDPPAEKNGSTLDQPGGIVLAGGKGSQLRAGSGKGIGCDLLALCGQLGAGLHAGGAQLTVGAGAGTLCLKVERMLGLGLLGLACLVQLAVDLGIGLGADSGAGGFTLGADRFQEPLGAGI